MNEIKGLVVSFEKDLQEDYVEELVKAIKLLKGVSDVSKEAVNIDDYMNRKQIEFQYKAQIYNIFK